jgi:tRNA(Ile)-lysidine synthase
MPLLKAENPKLAENLSAMALRLRQDEEALSSLASDRPISVTALRQQMPAVRARVLEQFLKECGVKEPEAQHIELAQALVFSDNPSARGNFPGGITVVRNYDTLQPLCDQSGIEIVPCCAPAEEIVNTAEVFTVHTVGAVYVRSRQSGDTMRLQGGTKSLKKLFIDRKIPSAQRSTIPVVCDEAGIIGVYGIGVNLDRVATETPATRISFQHIKNSPVL